MQNAGYGGYPATAGYYSNPVAGGQPPPQGAPGAAANAIPQYGTGAANPYGSSSYPQQPQAVPPTSDQYSSYTTTQPTYDTKSQQQAYMGYAQAANANAPPSGPPPNVAPNSVAPPPTSVGYGAASAGVGDAYGGANAYYQNQPGTGPAGPGSNPNQAQQPPPPYSTSYGNVPQGPNAPNAQSVGWQPSGPPPPPGTQSNYGPGPNGYGGGAYVGNGGGMNRGMPPGPNGPPPGPSMPPQGHGNFRGGPMGGRGNPGPGGYKAGPPPPQSAPGSGGGYMSQPSDMENDTIFISGMPLDVTEDQLSSHFGSIGIIKMDRSQKHKIWIYRDKVTGEGKGEATLTYEDPHTAKSAIQWFHNKELPGTGKILNVEFAQRKIPAGGDYKGGRGGGRGGGGGGPMRGRGGDGGRGGGGGGRGRDRERDNGFVRQGDWRCPGCNNNNFSWRDQCNRCKSPRPDDIGMPSGPGGGGGGGGGDHRRPPGPPMDRRGGPPMGGPGRRDGPPGMGGPPGMRGPHGDRPPMRGGGDRPPMRGRGGGPPRGGRGGDYGMRGPPMHDRRPKPY
ncbi:uncharacterized protein LOC113792743 [Dermatophagoides pteronyssinus]|uniref:uncharacterized protein LOC113792743 n=1 Tax=Dermatophagoides pteronyssinus TaxID=6956 RepID=UPI003F665E42